MISCDLGLKKLSFFADFLLALKMREMRLVLVNSAE